MTGRLWTEEEKAIVRQQWHTHQPVNKWLHLLPGRTFNGVTRIAKNMNIGERPGKPKLTYAHCWDCIKEALADGKMRTIQELEAITGFSNWNVRKHINHRLGSETYIAGWRLEGHHHVAMFLIGQNRENAVPGPLTPRQRANRNYYLKMKHFQPEQYEAMLRRKEIAREAAKIEAMPKAPDMAASWLFNPC